MKLRVPPFAKREQCFGLFDRLSRTFLDPAEKEVEPGRPQTGLADAKKMVVVGDFNGWDATQTPMVRVNDQGLWSVGVPLRAGKLYQFQYVKDDTLRLNDPSLPQVSSDLGSPNSALAIPAGPR